MMEAIKNNQSKSLPTWAKGLLIFITIATAAALFVIVLATSGMLPLGGRDLALDGSQHLVTADFRFAEEQLRVKAGETVRLVLDNQDRVPHSFDVDQWDVHVAMPGKSQVTAEFTPRDPGTYTFYCGAPGHAEAGMVGTIIVEP